MFLTNISIIIISYITLGICVELNYNVHLFYYPWYGSPTNKSEGWYHWNQNQHNPPKDIAADFYPVLGAYDSCDPKVLLQHMEWISESGVGTIIMSWWSQKDYTDKCVTEIMDAAHKHLIKVGFHIEPYHNRTAESVVIDIKYINDKYGKHPAYFRDPVLANRDAFYIFASVRIKDWSMIEPLKKNHIILANNYEEVIQINKTFLLKEFSGFYPYGIGAEPTKVQKWKLVNDFCKKEGCVWSPSIGPGYSDVRAKNHSKANQWSRNDGKTYDQSWEHIFESGIPHWVSITSFNEWHEGSVIEPVSSAPPSGHNYTTYSGAYGKTGNASEKAYIERTAFWVKEFTKRSKQ